MTRPSVRTADELLSKSNTVTSRHDHPLSPSSHPGIHRRISSHVPVSQSGYFDDVSEVAEGSRLHRSTNATTEADLLGVGPSRKLGKSLPGKEAVGMQLEKTRSRRSWRVFLHSLSKEELAVIETNFDDMTDDQLRSYVSAFDSPLRSTHDASDPPTLQASISTPTIALPTPPLPIPSAARQGDEPLFPPSPPPGETRPHLVEHPLRILSRAVRELREVVEGLEAENEKLRLLKEAGGVKSKGKRNRQADQVSIHEGLSEALATSLNDDRSHMVPAESIRSSSPGPSIHRAKSPAGSVRTVPVSSSSPAPSLYNVKSADTPASTGNRRNNGHRASWTSGLWIWSGGTGQRQTKTRPRKGSVGSASVISQAGTLGNVVEDTSALVDDVDEEAWRKGDGGSSPAFRAIFLATRIITPDPLSILVSPDIPSTSLVAYLAHSLVSTARDEGIVAKDPAGRRRANTASQPRSRVASVVSTDRLSVNSAPGPPSTKGYGDQAIAATASLGRSLLSSVSGGTIRPRVQDDQPARPSLLSRVSSSRPYPTTAVSDVPITPQISNTSPQLDPAQTLPSVEMASIVPDENRPPTVLLSRRQLGSFFQSSKSVPTLRTATRFKGTEPPLTDRYGFIYDVHHASMLKDANEAGIAAPAPLNGTGFHQQQTEPEGEGWIDRQRRKSQERPSVSRSSTDSSLQAQVPSPRRSLDAATSSSRASQPGSPGTVTPTRDSSHANVKRVRGSISVNMNPSPPRAVTAKDTLTVAARGSSSLQSRAVVHPGEEPPPYSTSTIRSPGSASLALPPDTSSSPLSSADAGTSRVTVSSLLDRLTGLHDLQQQERKEKWDEFLRSRRIAAKAKSGRRGRVEDMANGGPGLLGVGEMGRGEEWKAFLRLVRGGIPLAYRSDIWAECSGAKDMMVPGEYAEIQTVHRDDTSPFLAEIEKDVTRTFPGNIYFGGDGPGVAKLRRVLVAYSWYNPEVGYCQGMNMLAATLLLTHTDEEQAYWTLVSILSRILPAGYYTPDLVSSRADQLVLADLVALHLPKVHHHLVEELGVDLSSITFGWFLSLFTDCLPVETLFRVWDVFFVEGHATLFRIACSILRMHEADILACDSMGDLFTLMSTMTSRLWAADKLIAHAYKPIMKAGDIRLRCEKRVAELFAQAGDL